MSQAIENINRAERCRSTILMARIVDGGGRSVKRSCVAAIAYSISEWDQSQRDSCKIVAGHCAVPLDVEDVMYDVLQIGGGWNIDSIGFNFRHEIEFELPHRRSRNNLEIQYHLQSTFGDKITIRFRLGA